MVRDPVHWSELKMMGLSPAHFLAARENPKDSAGMRFGRLSHTIVLGGPPSAVWDGERRGNAWKEFKAANEGREIVTRDEVERATKVANAVLASPVARPLLAGQTERAVDWTMFGREFTTYGIDILGDGDWIADLKTSTSTEPGKFARQCVRMGYHAQLAAYLEAAASIGQPRTRAYIIGVEVAPPFAVTVLHVGPKTLDLGHRLNRLWTERLIACEAANEWPAYTQSIVELDADGDELGLIIDGEDEVVAA